MRQHQERQWVHCSYGPGSSGTLSSKRAKHSDFSVNVGIFDSVIGIVSSRKFLQHHSLCTYSLALDLA